MKLRKMALLPQVEWYASHGSSNMSSPSALDLGAMEPFEGGQDDKAATTIYSLVWLVVSSHLTS